MKHFRERNQAALGAGSLLALLLIVLVALNFRSLPVVSNDETYHAYFVNAGGLRVNDNVTVHGVKVGSVADMQLAGDKVDVTFKVESGVRIGNASSAAAKVLALVGTEYLEVTPEGEGRLEEPIPTSRTTVPFTFVDTLQQLSADEQEYDLPLLVESLKAGTEVLSGTTAKDTTAALEGLAKFSAVLAERKEDLSTVVEEGAGLAKTLADHRTQLLDLVGQGDLVLQVLQERRAALQQLFTGTTSLSREITRLLGPNRKELKSLLSNLETVAALLARDTASIDKAIPVLEGFTKYAANATGSGPFVDSSIPTMLLPDSLLAQCRSEANYPRQDERDDPTPVVGCRP